MQITILNNYFSLAETNLKIAHYIRFVSSANKKGGNQPTLARELIFVVMMSELSDQLLVGWLQFEDDSEIGAGVLRVVTRARTYTRTVFARQTQCGFFTIEFDGGNTT